MIADRKREPVSPPAHRGDDSALTPLIGVKAVPAIGRGRASSCNYKITSHLRSRFARLASREAISTFGHGATLYERTCVCINPTNPEEKAPYLL